jgi:hypothetical protein
MMEKLIGIVHFLHLEIYNTFGCAGIVLMTRLTCVTWTDVNSFYFMIVTLRGVHLSLHCFVKSNIYYVYFPKKILHVLHSRPNPSRWTKNL